MPKYCLNFLRTAYALLVFTFCISFNSIATNTMLSPLQNSEYTYGQDIVFEVDAAAPIQSIFLYIDGSLLFFFTSPPYTVTFNSLGVGNHEVYAAINYLDGSKATTSTVDFSIVSPVNKVASAPMIDGLIDPIWGQASTYTSVVGVQLSGISQSGNDLGGEFRMIWDDNYLYCLIEVVDDVGVNDSGAISDDDGVELYIDINNDKAQSYGTDDVLLTFPYGDPGVVESNSPSFSTSGISYCLTDNSVGYILELQIPWANFSYNPQGGDYIGFDLMLNDDDNGLGRDLKKSWASKTDDAWSNPSVFGTIILVDDLVNNVFCENKIYSYSTQSTSLIQDTCLQGAWTHYLDPANPSKILFSVKKKDNNVVLEVDLVVEPMGNDAFILGNDAANYVLGRHWEVEVLEGEIASTVDVRFYFDSQELVYLNNTASGYAAVNGLSLNSLSWFQSLEGEGYDQLQFDENGITDVEIISKASYGSVLGRDYVQLNNLEYLSSGSAFINTNLILLNTSIEMFELNDAKLCWEVNKEDKDNVALLGSVDGENFEVVMNSTESIGCYSTIVGSFEYYQLVVASVEEDGLVKSEVLYSEKNNHEALSFYPNPTTDSFRVNIIGALSREYRVVNALGVEIEKGELAAESQLGLFWPQGMYYLSFVNGETVVLYKQ